MTKKITNIQLDRALGALLGGAFGDALGMPSQTLTCKEIEEKYGKIADFVDPFEGHPVSHGLKAGVITDDTEQSLLLAKHIIATPNIFDDIGWAKTLLGWEADVKARGLYDLLGPSTKRALDALLDGVPVNETGKFGNTNGAAMRIGPVGIATPINSLENFVDYVQETCVVTHNTSVAIASASAVAAVISTGLDGGTFTQACEIGLEAARVGSTRGYQPDGPSQLAERISLALDIAGNYPAESALLKIQKDIGTSVASEQSIPAAFGVVKIAQGDAWKAGLLSANIGDDTDTIGAIAAGMAGACSGASSLPEDKMAFLKSVNQMNLEEIANGLLKIRQQRRMST